MKYNFKTRMQAYYGLIGYYDFVEKYNLFNSKIKNLKSLDILWTTNKFAKDSLNSILLKEFLTCQRFGLLNLTNKNKVNLNYFIITLRSLHLFLYLEVLFNTYFLFSKIKYNTNSLTFFNTYVFIEILYYNLFFANFSSKFNIQKEFLNTIISLHFFKNKYKTTSLSYYFLPKTTRRIA